MSFPFEHTKKKKNTENQFWRKLLPFYAVDAKIWQFWPKLWLFCFMADFFFSYVQKESSYEKPPEDSFFSPTFFLFWVKKNYFHDPEGKGEFT